MKKCGSIDPSKNLLKNKETVLGVDYMSCSSNYTTNSLGQLG